MTEVRQNFSSYAGDNTAPIVTVRDANGVVIDLSGVQQITFTAQRTLDDNAIVTKLKSTGGIALVGGGTGGQFQINLLPTDSASLFGNYLWEALVTDSTGNVSTVSTGTWSVGRKPAQSYSGDPAVSTKDAVRFLIDDTGANDLWLLTDPEIAYVLTTFPDPRRAAASCARKISVKYAGRPDKTVGDLSISWSQISTRYAAMADLLESEATLAGDLTPYAGGISVADMAAVEANSDRVTPSFKLGQFDNTTGPLPSDAGWPNSRS